MAPEKDLERGLDPEKDATKTNPSNAEWGLEKEEVPRPDSVESDTEHEEVEALDAGHQQDLARQQVSRLRIILSNRNLS